jgi:hypothetical protein
VVCYSNGSDTVLDDDVLVILAVSRLHESPDIIGRHEGLAISSRRERFKILARGAFTIHGCLTKHRVKFH